MTNDDQQNLGYCLTILAEYHASNLGAAPRHDECRADAEREVIRVAGWTPTGRRGWYTKAGRTLPHGDAFVAAEGDLDDAWAAEFAAMVRGGTVRLAALAAAEGR